MDEKRSLHILWTNADPETSQFMVMMYATNSMLHHWWDEVTVIVWGATARFAAENPQIQDAIQAAMHAGVKFSACSACARQLGVIEKLQAQGIEVIPWGAKLTEILQGNGKLITV